MTDIKSILLHVDALPASITRLAVARQLAARHGARITALYAATVEASLQEPQFSYSAAALLAGQDEWFEEHHVAARRRLQRLADSPGPSVEWCDVVGETVQRSFLQEAAYADLVVVGRSTGEAGGPGRAFVESMILESGRPVLVVPDGPGSGAVGSRVLVAWDGSAPSARALASALPILQRAEQVHVASWSDRLLAAPFSRVDVGRYLEEHDVVATRHSPKATPRVADEMVALATRLAADLVVMGCYGHSRARERVFGGASRSALAQVPVPLLMAH